MLRLVVIAALAACSSARTTEPSREPPGRAFYYWRSTLTLSPTETSALADQRISRVYVRAFDIAWNAETKKVDILGPLTVTDKLPAGIEAVPVVFIRQNVFRMVGAGEIPALAKRAWAEVAQRMEPLGAPRELQLDCDWTERSRDGFFAFARAIKAEGRVPLSATIRLHQIKYRERTGVPPVERGALMVYNMGEMRAGDEARSIFDAETTKKYLGRLGEYPLPLDVALPIFSWTLHTREGAVEGLLQTTDPDELPMLDFVRPASTVDTSRYVVTRTAFLHGSLLREGDVLEVERTTPADTLAAAALVRPHVHARSIVLFDLSDKNLSRYSHEQLDAIYSSLP